MMSTNGHDIGPGCLKPSRYRKPKSAGSADDECFLTRELFFHGKRIAEEY